MTIKDCLNRAAEEYPEQIALRFKQRGGWQTITYKTLRERAWHVSEMLAQKGVGAGDRVALCLENAPEWFEIYYGIVALGAVAVPVDAKLREQELAHIFHDAGVSVVFCAVNKLAVFDDIAVRTASLKLALVLGIDAPPQSERVSCAAYETLWETVSMTALQSGRAFDCDGPSASSPASLIYTSGTTGRQKGAMLTHGNFLANVSSIVQAINVRPTDNFMLVLPLHHAFAFTCNLLVPLYVGCEVSLVENLRSIKANMADCSPTVLLAVPLLLEKMLARVMDGVQSNFAARWMFRLGLGKVVGRKVSAGLGGALRLVVSGGAPIRPVTLETWTKLGIAVVEGYGITETAPVLCVNPPEAPRIGTVGPPLGGVEIKIHEPNAEGVGEIVVRGDNVMQGYYNHADETAKVLIDGWYYTGDLGCFDDAGYLLIKGRKKSLIVNREGKNIYPEEVERQAMQSRYVLECLALGYCDSGEDPGERVGMIVVPDQQVFDELERAEERCFSESEIEQIVRDDVRAQMAHLSEYKRPRRIEVRFEEFEKTATQKVKRYLYAVNTAPKV
ncbi:MAG: AMP-binding protein [Pontiellaceae bacterium]|nr:AMP-binding protein [Pontiellaceae bacterium]